ncbi:MAG: integrase [Betaproteobacteria bacterium HGW-Betaproteobacteria-13]|jgi:integrase|nr:MAG: integrase [Betaproteobacteria bacterium HGW-Betaproteobacteria-13]
MGRAHKLTPAGVERQRIAGLYGDGAGLWLKVTPGGSKSWILRYASAGRERWAGLGPYPDVGLADARELASDYRKKVRAGIDPLDEKHEQDAATRAARAKSVTFDWCAQQYIDAHKAGWKNPKHVDQWRNTLATYASPTIGKLDVAKIDTAHVMKVLQEDDLWTTKAETASRLRGRIESVLGWATTRNFRSGENPARWRGHLENLLPHKSKIQKVKHHAALPWPEASTFMADLRKQAGVGARALEFAILTAARSGEVRGMTWGEVDLTAGVWIVPADRMKAGNEHRVPLTQQAIKVLEAIRIENPKATDLVFPGIRSGKPLSDMTLGAVLKRMNRPDLTAHGFRSTFRDWAAEATDYPRDMAEMALAHTVSDKVEAAYRRGDMFEKRRKMMADWAAHCEKTKDTGEEVSPQEEPAA